MMDGFGGCDGRLSPLPRAIEEASVHGIRQEGGLLFIRVKIEMDLGEADGIFELRNYISRDVEIKTQFLIRKMRGTEHSRKFHSVLFTPHGMEILPYTP